MAKKKIAALLIAAAVAAGGWALPARVSAAENDGTAVTWQQDETENSEQNLDEEAAVQEQSGTSENETPAVTIPGEDNEQEPEEKLPAGWVKQEDGSWKYRKEDGTMAASEWITHLNRRYYLNADEIMCTGLSMVNGKLYYFESWGGAGYKGWKKVGGAWYYLNEDGSVKTNEWFVHDKRTYHVDENGVMSTGLQKIDGTLYYFESWGGAGFQGWKKVGGTWYYLNEDGSLRTNQWFVHDKRTYHVDADGVMSTGWQTIDGVDYYFESWGGMRVNAWAAKGSDWYYMDSNGTPKGEGWLLYDKNWYYLRQDGKMMHSEWLWYDNNWYYLQSWGGMYKSQWVTIKGATYYFRSWGGIYKNGWQEVDGKTYYFRSWGGIYKDTYIDGYYVDKNGVRRNSKNICVAINAGHQRRGNSEKEPIGPGSSTYKAKVASGTCGVATGINEYELNLAVSLKVRDILEERGYDVYMIRETHDVNISNSERAKLAAQNGSDILVRVHANGDSNQSVYGALTMAPSSRNTYLSGDVISKSQKLSQKMIAAFCKDTGAKNRDVIYTDSMSGINWSTIPVTIIELGFMSNPSEDRLMATEDYRNKMAQGIADGIDAYYE